MKTWKELFPRHILARGLDYYEMEKVYDVQTTTNGFEADVEGTEDYHVKISLQDKRIVDMTCDCPYAWDGNYCKHMAAVLYAIENDELGEGESFEQRNEVEKELKEVIDTIPVEEMKMLLFELAANDGTLKNRILTQYGPITTLQIARLKKIVDEIGYKYSDRGGFVDYYHASDYAQKLYAFMEDHIPILIQKGHHMNAFEVVNCVFQEIGNRDMDDSGGESTYVADRCYEYWQQILEVCTEAEQKELFQWFLSHRENYVIDYMEDYINDFLVDEFQDEELLRLKMADLDKMISLKETESESGQSYSIYYGWVSNILERIRIMEKLNYSPKEIKEYRNRFRKFSEIRRLEIEEYVNGQDYENAIKVLEESKVLDKDYKGLVSNYSTQLIEIYKETNKKCEYKNELIDYVFSGMSSDITYMMKLKEVCDEQEWENYREQIFSSKNSYQIQLELLEKEGLYRRLFEKVCENDFISTLDKYEDVLKKYFPEEVRDVYIDYVKKAMYRASARNMYRDLVGYLKKIKSYPDGVRLAQEVADEWKREYKRRSAMVDELKRGGF